MLTIIIGTIIVIATMEKIVRRKKLNEFCVGFVSVLVVLAVIVTAVFIPLSGYTEWVLESENELIPFSQDKALENEKTVYVVLSEQNVYKYRYKVNAEDFAKTLRLYREGVAQKEKVEKIEDPECEIPVVRKYNRQGKKTVWTYGGLAEQNKTVFYVPPGTILE